MKHSDDTLYWAWVTVQLIRADANEDFMYAIQSGFYFPRDCIDGLSYWWLAMSRIHNDRERPIDTRVENACQLLDSTPITLPHGVTIVCGTDNWKLMWKRGRKLVDKSPWREHFPIWLDRAPRGVEAFQRHTAPDGIKRLTKTVDVRVRKHLKEMGIYESKRPTPSEPTKPAKKSQKVADLKAWLSSLPKTR